MNFRQFEFRLQQYQMQPSCNSSLFLVLSARHFSSHHGHPAH